MATFVFTLQGVTPTTIDVTDTLQFAGAGGFDTNVTVGAYNDSTHVKSSGAANDSAGNTPRNNKYLTSSTVSVNGGGSTALSGVSTANCALRINFSDAASVAISNAIFYAYDGTTPATGPTGVTFQAAEQGDTNWTLAEGSGGALGLTDQAANTSHDYYILVSASPDSVGLKSAFTLRMELTYS